MIFKNWMVPLMVGIAYVSLIVGMMVTGIGNSCPAYVISIDLVLFTAVIVTIPLMIGIVTGYYYAKEGR